MSEQDVKTKDSKADELSKDLDLKKVQEFFIEPYHAYGKIDPTGPNDVQECVFTFPTIGVKVVDDSKVRPNVNIVRNAVASGSLSTRGVYDFEDGKDNGYTPALRKIAPDRTEVDEAVATIQEAAKNAKAKKDQEKLNQDADDLKSKALKGLSALADISEESSSSDLSS